MPSRTSSIEPKQERSRATRRRLLDAAVDELVERGYAGFTAQAVARRAGVSRGAQQNHFPEKTMLVAHALGHLSENEMSELRAVLERAPEGPKRELAALDAIFEAYSGDLFTAMLELSLVARKDPKLHDAISAEERKMSKALSDVALEIFGPEQNGAPKRTEAWATALSAVRGLALLKILGHPTDAVDRQWQRTRQEIIRLLGSASS